MFLIIINYGYLQFYCVSRDRGVWCVVCTFIILTLICKETETAKALGRIEEVMLDSGTRTYVVFPVTALVKTFFWIEYVLYKHEQQHELQFDWSVNESDTSFSTFLNIPLLTFNCINITE